MSAQDPSGRDPSHTPPELSDERQRMYSVLRQVDELQRAGETRPESALLEINKANVASVPGARYAGVTLVSEHGVVSTLAATHDYPKRLDHVQGKSARGPACRRRGTSTSSASTTAPPMGTGPATARPHWNAPRCDRSCFELLRSLSQQSNAKLIDVAEKLINADYPID